MSDAMPGDPTIRGSGIVIVEEPAASEDVRWCFEQFYTELARRFEGGFEASHALPLDSSDLTPPRGLVLIARLGGRPVGSAALKLHAEGVGEIKRMWVSPDARGRGLGGRLLAALESRAVEAGKPVTRLETNGTLTEAIAMYRRRGYREVEPFNDERYADHWFEKDLTGNSDALIGP